jgi:tetratricopeptide (TPR) repeat protein
VVQAYKSALILRGDWGELADFIEQTPPNQWTDDDRMLLARSLVKSGRAEAALRILEPVIAERSSVDAVSIASEAYFDLGRTREAGQLLDSVWDKVRYRKLVDDITRRGISYFRENDLDNAETTLTLAVSIEPGNIGANNALSLLFAKKGDQAAAEKYRATTRELQEKSTVNLTEASRRVQRLYELEDAWNAKQYRSVITIALQLIEIEEDKGIKLGIYQYLFESYRALGRQAEADAVLAQIRLLQSK